MNEKNFDISDNEIRIIGAETSMPHQSLPSHDDDGEKEKPEEKKKSLWKWVAIGMIALFLLILGLIFSTILFSNNKRIVVEEIVDTVQTNTEITETVEPAENIKAELIIKEDTINDIEFTILTPQGCKAELHIGAVDTLDKSVVLCAQAADIRGDNGEIVCAYILKGELKSRGIAKKGFCAIIDGSVTLGMAEETPLYERVVEAEGDFFRQFPLVHDSQMQENKSKGKAIRNALCILNGKACIIHTKDKESLHDFAQALQDYGVTEAISLTGSDATLFGRTDDGAFQNLGKFSNYYKNQNYIIFRK